MLNPMTALIQMYRDVLLYHQLPAPQDVAVTIAAGLFIMVVGTLVFKKLERRFAEEI